MATIYWANDTREEVALPRTAPDLLRELQDIVGGLIETIAVGDKIMVLNDDGKAKRLRMNREATRIARPYLFDWDWGIAGNAVLATWDELEGDVTDEE